MGKVLVERTTIVYGFMVECKIAEKNSNQNCEIKVLVYIFTHEEINIIT